MNYGFLKNYYKERLITIKDDKRELSLPSIVNTFNGGIRIAR